MTSVGLGQYMGGAMLGLPLVNPAIDRIGNAVCARLASDDGGHMRHRRIGDVFGCMAARGLAA